MNKIGRLAENIAKMFLEKHLYLIIAQNWKNRLGELDIIAKDIKNNDIVFVEVKSARLAQNGSLTGETHFTRNKFDKVVKLAQIYLLQNKLNSNWRIDLIVVDFRGNTYRIKHYQNLSF